MGTGGHGTGRAWGRCVSASLGAGVGTLRVGEFGGGRGRGFSGGRLNHGGKGRGFRGGGMGSRAEGGVRASFGFVGGGIWRVGGKDGSPHAGTRDGAGVGFGGGVGTLGGAGLGLGVGTLRVGEFGVGRGDVRSARDGDTACRQVWGGRGTGSASLGRARKISLRDMGRGTGEARLGRAWGGRWVFGEGDYGIHIVVRDDSCRS